jgi:hypothetical protein
LPIWAGVMTDKWLITSGEATARIERVDLSADQEEVARLLAQARAVRAIETGIEGGAGGQKGLPAPGPTTGAQLEVAGPSGPPDPAGAGALAGASADSVSPATCEDDQ